jgi:hypothetical protein
MRTAILTISSSVAAGANEDLSGEALAELARASGGELVAQDVVADDADAIGLDGDLARHWADRAALPLTSRQATDTRGYPTACRSAREPTEQVRGPAPHRAAR